MIVAHDPGHGKIHDGVLDGGTLARFDANGDGVVDAQDTEALVVSKLVSSIVDGIDWVTHTLLRDGPVGPPYSTRAKMAKDRGASIVLCHHINAYADDKPSGFYSYYLPESELGHEVASAMARSAPRPVWRGAATPAGAKTSQGAKNILDCYAAAGVTAVLLEWGFATNPSDRAFLSDLRWRPAIVACAAVGIAHAMAMTHGIIVQ